jgi:TolB protein
VLGLAAGALGAQQPPPTPPPIQQQSPTDISTRITGEPGTPPRLAVPDLLALSPDKEVQDAAKVIGEVLWNDMDFEREFYMVPRDTYRSIPAATSIGEVPFDRWRELGADGVVIGTVQRVPTGIRVEMRLYNVRARVLAAVTLLPGAAANPRVYAHTMADEIHQSQRSLRGVARTKLAFASDRNRDPVANTVEKREVKEIYVADYDGANQRRITINRTLNITPNWSPDGRAIAYTSYRKTLPDILISNIYVGTLEEPAKGVGQNFLPVFSPDGKQIAFMSNRDGNSELYVMNRDGSGVRRLTDRTGSPQIYVVAPDGTGLRRLTFESYADRATWSPAPYNEIAFAARTGPGFDIKILNLGDGVMRQITFGEGTNESPAWSPNGRHLAFVSTRAGRNQVFTVDRDGRNVRQVTREGNNSTPNWSQ